jgi:hypothetical protein
VEKTTIEDARRVIAEIIRSRPSGTAPGQYLGAVLRYKLEAFRPLDFGVPTLKTFIQKFVPEVEVHVNSPTEVAYALKGAPIGDEMHDLDTVQSASQKTSEGPSQDRFEAKELSEIRLPSSIWFAFVAAASKTRITLQQQTGELKLENSGNPNTEGWVRIEPLTPDDHRAIARDFSERIPHDHRSKIDSLIDSGQSWWKAHYSALEELGLGSAYRRFHSSRVLQRLDHAVREKVGRGLKTLRLPSGRLVSEYTPPVRSFSAQTKTRSTAEPVKDDLLRSLAERLVRGMSRAELRRIKVSLGDVVDLL